MLIILMNLTEIKENLDIEILIQSTEFSDRSPVPDNLDFSCFSSSYNFAFLCFNINLFSNFKDDNFTSIFITNINF